MRITLNYGRTGLPVELPDERVAAVLHMHRVPVLEDPEGAVARALAAPLGTPPLRELTAGKRSACIVVSDITRPVPNRVILRPLLQALEAGGIPRERITLLIATGLHRPNEGAELEEMIGADLANTYRVVNHVARDDSQQESLGTLDDGTPVAINREYLKADLRIVTGLVEPHLMAGYSGGRKLICPGIASKDTIRQFHHPRMLEPAEASNGVLEGNPVHRFSLAVARKARVDFNVCVTLDEHRRLTGVFAGELEQAHYAGIEQANKMVRVAFDEPAEVVVTSCAGYPLDTTVYQSVKGAIGALPAVKQGGTIVMAASLTEGIGSPDFVQLLDDTESMEQFTNDMWRDDFFYVDQWQLEEHAKVLRKASVSLYSDGLPAAEVERCFVTFVESVEAGVEAALAKAGPEAKIIAIPEGPYVLPVLAKR
jgi:nickel-dependent lactate racemase